MSYTEIFGFDKTGDAYSAADIRNAFRGSMAIWMYLEGKYLPPYLPEYAKKIGIKTTEEFEQKKGYKSSRCMAITEQDAMKEIWDLVYSDTISETDKICLYTTFDNCLVRKENMPKLIK